MGQKTYGRQHDMFWTLLLVACSLPFVSASCTNYTSRPNERSSTGAIYSSTGGTRRVSEIVDCTGTKLGTQPPAEVSSTRRCNATQCALYTPANYYVAVGSSLNISTASNDTYDSIMKLVQRSVQDPRVIDWNRTVAARITITPYGQCIGEGQASYVAFTPTYLCTEGVLSGCSGDGPKDGTAIRACGLEAINPPLYNGELGFVNTGDVGDQSFNAAPPNATIPDNGAAAVFSGTSRYILVWTVAVLVFVSVV